MTGKLTVKHTLYHATFKEYEIEIPSHCPGCDADLREQGALREGNYVDCVVWSHLSPEGSPPAVEPEGESQYGDEYWPFGLICAKCDQVFGDFWGEEQHGSAEERCPDCADLAMKAGDPDETEGISRCARHARGGDPRFPFPKCCQYHGTGAPATESCAVDEYPGEGAPPYDAATATGMYDPEGT
jgi:hypothetical protein